MLHNSVNSLNQGFTYLLWASFEIYLILCTPVSFSCTPGWEPLLQTAICEQASMKQFLEKIDDSLILFLFKQ
jgi:hypothetical protein